MENADFVTRSGRETLSVSARIALLRSDLLYEPFLGVSGDTPASSQTIHDLKLTVGMIRNTIELYEQAVQRGQTDETLKKGSNAIISPTECIVLAWRRGGHKEYERILRLQRAQ